MARARPARSNEPQRALRARSVAVASACSAAAAGFELCARRTHDVTTAVAATSAAAFLRSLQAATAAVSKQRLPRPRTRTCERLRWEWLASTATILDGAPDARLARECARILSEVTRVDELPARIVARFRLALAEAHSLSSAIERMHRPPPRLVPAYS